MDSLSNKVSPPSEKEKEEKEKELIKDFGGYTTLHGFHFLFDSSFIIRRVIWMSLILAGFGFLCFQLFNAISKLKANGVILSKGIEEPSGPIEFPAVTICNQNIMKKSQIIGTAAQRYLDAQDVWKQTVMNRLNNPINVSNERFDSEYLVRKYGFKLQDFFEAGYSGCTFKESQCNLNEFAMFTTITRGLCYTFNSGRTGSHVHRVANAGRNNRLVLRLDAKSKEYYGPFSYEGVGFRLALHDQRHFPNMDEDGIDISPGFYTNIRVKRQKEKSLQAPYETNCGERKLSYFKSYSRSSCLHECHSRLVVKTCSCRYLGLAPLKEVNESRFCNKEDVLKCIYNDSAHDLTTCDCPKPCTAISYNEEISLGYYPSPSVLDVLFPLEYKASYNMTPEEFIVQSLAHSRKELALVSIYYKTLRTDVIEEKPEYSISTFGSELGGNMGLFLGCSLLTVAEFIDLVIQLCYARCKNRQ